MGHGFSRMSTDMNLHVYRQGPNPDKSDNYPDFSQNFRSI